MSTKAKAAAAEKETSAPVAALGTATEALNGVRGAVVEGGKAYVNGVMELGRAFTGFGRDTLSLSVEHAQTTVKAKNLREVGELQVAFAHNRVEAVAAQAKDIADLARIKSEEVIAPFAALLDQK